MNRTRREYLSVIGLAVTGAVAGCSSESSDDVETEPAGDGDDSESTEEVSTTEAENRGGASEPTDEVETTEEIETTEDTGADSEFVNEIDGQVILEYEETAHLSTGVNVTAHGLTLYDQMGDEQPEERDAFAVLEVTTKNTSDQQRDLPSDTGGWEVFYGNTQVDQTFRYGALDAEDYTGLEGGTVQGGVKREGVILFEVNDGFSEDEIDALWSDNFLYIEESGQRIDVRWTTNP